MERGFAGGILNRGNTCYISSSLQVLLRFKPFHDLVTALAHKFEDVEFFRVLEYLSRKLETATEVLTPDSIISLFGIDASKQFDVCEFMTKLLNDIVEITNDPEVASHFYFHFDKLDSPENVLFRGIQIVEGASIGDVLASSQSRLSLNCCFFSSTE